MTSQLLEALVARSSLRPRVQQPPECFGKYIGSINFANHCWAAKGSVRDRFYSELKPEILRHLDGWFGSVSSKDWVTLSVYMIGKTQKTAAPTVLFISENDRYRKEARKVIKDSGILKQYPGFKTAHISKDPGWGEQLEQLASGQGTKTSIQNDNPVTEVFYERPKSLQPVGMPIYVRHGSSMRAATANAIRLRGRLFYLAPCHAFFDRLYKSNAPTAKPDEDFEIDSDSETEYNDELEASITSIGSQSPDTWSDNDDSSDDEDYSTSCDIFSHGSSSTPTFDAPELTNTTAASLPLEEVNDKFPPFAKAQVNYPPRELTTPPLDSLAPLGVLVDWSVDQDWALVEVVENGDANISSILSTNLPDLSTAQIALLPQDDAKVVTHTASGGQMTGTIAGTPSYTRVPHGTSFQEVFSINLDGPLADGDCGSAVFNVATGELFGHIVAGCRTTGFAYVMAAHHVFPELEKSAQQIKDVAGTRLCSDCTHFDSASELRTLGDNCPLCKLLPDVAPRDHSGSHQQIPIVRDGLALKTAGPRIICLCADLGSSLPSFNNTTNLSRAVDAADISNTPSSVSASLLSPGEAYQPYSPSFPYTIECAHSTYFGYHHHHHHHHHRHHHHHHHHQQQQQQQQQHSTTASTYGYYSPKSFEEVGMAREPEGALPIGPNDSHPGFRDPFDDLTNHSGMSLLVPAFLENDRRLGYPNNDHRSSLGSFGYELSSMHVSSPSPLQGSSHQAMPQQNMQTPVGSVYASGTSQNGVEPTLIAPAMQASVAAVVNTDLSYVSSPTQTSAQLPLAHSEIQCLYCEQTFTGVRNIGNRERHVQLKHCNPEESNQDLTCQWCGKNYLRKDAKKKHEWKKHRKGRPPVKRRRIG